MSLTDAAHELALSMGRRGAAIAAQLERAALSIPTNIAEGYGRSSRREYLQFLSIAVGSLREVETLALVAKRRGYGNPKLVEQVLALADETGRVLYGLTRSLSLKAAKVRKWPG